MKCFEHQGVDAVATCKNCGKGLCPHCLVERTGGISCRGNCEELVEAVHKLTLRAMGTPGKTSAIYTRMAIYTGLSGLVFLSVGLSGEFTELNYFLIAMALVTFVGAAFYYRSAVEFRKKD